MLLPVLLDSAANDTDRHADRGTFSDGTGDGLTDRAQCRTEAAAPRRASPARSSTASHSVHIVEMNGDSYRLN